MKIIIFNDFSSVAKHPALDRTVLKEEDQHQIIFINF